MNDITNSKIRTLLPAFSKFEGFSALFDNLGDNNYTINKIQSRSKFYKIDCQLDSPEILFFQRLHEIFSLLHPSLPMKDYQLCPLPFSSYHITATDFGNKGNLKNFNPDSERHFNSLFSKFPDSLINQEDFIGREIFSELKQLKNLNLKFKFEELGNWGEVVLVAKLQPADEFSKKNLEKFEKIRLKWNQLFQSNHGYSTDIKDKFTPHCSLAYFTNKQYSRIFETYKETWNEEFLQQMVDKDGNPLVIEFQSVSLYAFVDMTTFFKVSNNIARP